MEISPARKDILDEGMQKKLWEYSEGMVQEAEKRGAARRAKTKKEAEQSKKDDVKPAEEKKKQPGSRRSRKA